ncbi:MAG: WYL domain-containing protein [Clostridia bacterium]|nr:WYL domain-containing protein [Clostridia bacterium]
MSSKQPKKQLILNILDILKRYTDENHRLSQREIADILKKEYKVSADRKTVRRNILDLMELGYEIEYSEAVRMVPNKVTREPEESYIWSDFYLVRDFSDSELRLLIDSLLFSKHIPYSQCKELVEKLEGLSSRYFEAKVKHIRALPDNSFSNRQLFFTIDVLDEAISRGKQVSFCYNRYDTDKKLHREKNSDGKPKVYTVNPYQMAVANGRYYLIANYDKYDDVSHYRLDRITDIEILQTPVKPTKRVKGLENGLYLPTHMAEHIYMFSGESIPVVFRAKRYIVGDILDWFGRNVQFSDETDDEVTVRVTANEKAMRRWGLQYALHTKIISPESLSQQIREDIARAAENYMK